MGSSLTGEADLRAEPPALSAAELTGWRDCIAVWSEATQKKPRISAGLGVLFVLERS